MAWTQLLTTSVRKDATDGEIAVEYLCSSPRGEHDSSIAVRATLGGGDHTVTQLPQVESMAAAIDRARTVHADQIISCVAALPRDFATATAKRLLQISPCSTFVLLSGERDPSELRRILAIVSGNAHDAVVFELARKLARSQRAQITVATIEDDVGAGAEGVGTRELQQFLRQMDA